MVYLDNAATTFPKPESVYKAMDDCNRKFAVNAGRGSYRLAREASGIISETKDLLRKLVHADMDASVILAPSITVALNQIINGLEMVENANVYVSPYEHNAVCRPLHNISKTKTLNIIQLPLKEDTLEIDMDKVKYQFSMNKPDFVICTHVSNVTGYILPISDIFSEAKEYGAITIMDSAQSLGLIPVDVKQMKVDIVSFAGHKCLYGPMGVGGFINVSNINLNVFIAGGTGSDSLNLDMPDGKESKYEASSTNIVAIVGLNAALKELNVEKNYAKEKLLCNYLIDKLKEISNVKLLLPGNDTEHIGVVSFVMENMSSEDVGFILDEDFDICVRTGYHCAAYVHEYLGDKRTLGTVRVGLSIYNDQDDIDKLITAIESI